MLDAMSRGNPGQEPAKAAGMGRAPRVGSQTASFGPPDRWLAVGAVAGQTAIAAGTFLIAKQTLVTIPPLALAMMRMAGAALFLCSAASEFVHGHVLVVDGGWMGR